MRNQPRDYYESAYRKESTHTLTQMVKALSVAYGFFNDDDDNLRLDVAKKELASRKKSK